MQKWYRGMTKVCVRNKRKCFVASFFLSMLMSTSAKAVWDMTIEFYVGNFHGSAEVCRALMPDEVSAGLAVMELKLKAEQQDLLGQHERAVRPDVKSALEQMRARHLEYRRSPEYAQAVQDEKQRLQLLAPEEVMQSCKLSWGHFTKIGPVKANE